MYAIGVLQALVVVLLVLCQQAAASKALTWFDQSWFFAWDPPGAPLPTPTTAQCETIHITWSRQTATGPDPVAPYFLRIYTSNFVFPFVVPAGSNPETYLTIPFAPGTQYEICMFDSNNSTGGCQAIYTVYPNTTTSTPTCANLTAPAKTLDVLSEYSPGKLSQYGWVDSCTDIRVTPQSGTPPFTFTVAPALHPPLNITSNDMSPINWTVGLTWASPFFISLVDSTGLSWSNGPIHSGKGSNDCIGAIPHSGVAVSVTVSAAVAGAVAGALASILAGFLIARRRKGYEYETKPIPFYSPYSPWSPHERSHFLHPRDNSTNTTKTAPYERVPSLTETLHEFQVEPFIPGSHAAASQSDSVTTRATQATQPPWHDGSDGRGHNPSPTVTSPVSGNRHQETANNQVYVIHHDSGRAPVSVVTSQGTEVVELPPNYSSSYASGASPGASQGGPRPSAPRRQWNTKDGSVSSTPRIP